MTFNLMLHFPREGERKGRLGIEEGVMEREAPSPALEGRNSKASMGLGEGDLWMVGVWEVKVEIG